MNNKYYILRHGESEANRLNLIISSPENGITNYGLTENGRNQAAEAGRRLVENGFDSKNTVFFSSDFKRAYETAQIAAGAIDIELIYVTPALRERFFGIYEKQSSSNYELVWELDKNGREDHSTYVEPVYRIAERATALINNCEKWFTGKNIILVSHGDILQITLTVTAGKSPNQHREIEHLQNCELRELNFKGELSLP